MAVNALHHDISQNALVELQTSDLETLSQYVLSQLAQTTEFDLSVTSGTDIGQLPDSYAAADVDQLVSDDFGTTIVYNTIKQAQTSTVSGSNPPDYVGYTVSGLDVVIQERATTLNDLADQIITRLTTPTYGGVGSWYLGINPPSDGGTWVSKFSVVDTLDVSTTNTTYYFWKKTVETTGSPSISAITKRPLKISGSELVTFNDDEINYITKTVAERIASLGVNFYQIATTVPSTGTWVQASESIYDYTRVIASQENEESYVPETYTGPADFQGPSSAGYEPTNYIRSISFAGPGPGYLGLGVGSFNTNYLGPGPVSFSGYQGIGPNGAYFRAYYVGVSRVDTTYFTSTVSYNSNQGFVGPGLAYYPGPLYSGESDFVGTYVGGYIGGLVTAPTELLNTYYMWRRVA